MLQVMTETFRLSLDRSLAASGQDNEATGLAQLALRDDHIRNSLLINAVFGQNSVMDREFFDFWGLFQDEVGIATPKSEVTD